MSYPPSDNVFWIVPGLVIGLTIATAKDEFDPTQYMDDDCGETRLTEGYENTNEYLDEGFEIVKNSPSHFKLKKTCQ
jgi:hypothetical protein